MSRTFGGHTFRHDIRRHLRWSESIWKYHEAGHRRLWRNVPIGVNVPMPQNTSRTWLPNISRASVKFWANENTDVPVISLVRPRPLVHFLAVLCKPTMRNDGKFLFLFLYFDAVHSNLGPWQFASIFHIKRIRIIAKELQKREVIFWNDVPSSSQVSVS